MKRRAAFERRRTQWRKRIWNADMKQPSAPLRPAGPTHMASVTISCEKSWLPRLAAAVVVVALGQLAPATATASSVPVDVVLHDPITPDVRAQLETHGRITGQITKLNAVTMRADESKLAAIRGVGAVKAATIEAFAGHPNIDPIEASDLGDGRSTFNLDALDITELGVGRTIAQDGSQTYIAVLDTGLDSTWRAYLPQARVDTALARGFVGANPTGTSADAKATIYWERDTYGHGMSVASTMLGFDLDVAYAPNHGHVNGVSPNTTIIPIRVAGNYGAHAATVASGLIYVADLKAGALDGRPLIATMSLAFRTDDAILHAAVDYAIARGVLVVAAAGNTGAPGLRYPAALPQVISAGAAGWIGQWLPGPDDNPYSFWRADDVPEPTSGEDFFIADYSTRAATGEDLDVVVPANYVFVPNIINNGKRSLDYYWATGTSFAAPQVAGTLALMAQKRPDLTQGLAEELIESTAVAIGPSCRLVTPPPFVATSPINTCWGSDATGHGILNARQAVAATP